MKAIKYLTQVDAHRSGLQGWPDFGHRWSCSSAISRGHTPWACRLLQSLPHESIHPCCSTCDRRRRRNAPRTRGEGVRFRPAADGHGGSVDDLEVCAPLCTYDVDGLWCSGVIVVAVRRGIVRTCPDPEILRPASALRTLRQETERDEGKAAQFSTGVAVPSVLHEAASSHEASTPSQASCKHRGATGTQTPQAGSLRPR